MPTYEYACKKCGEHLEVVQSFKDKALTTCPACGGALRKVFGNVGIVFKGSGFYKTDSRPNAGKKESATASSSTGSGSSGDSSSSKDSGTTKDAAATKDSAAKKDSKDSKSSSTKASGRGTPAASAAS